jgi:hypothetical protein
MSLTKSLPNEEFSKEQNLETLHTIKAARGWFDRHLHERDRAKSKQTEWTKATNAWSL